MRNSINIEMKKLWISPKTNGIIGLCIWTLLMSARPLPNLSVWEYYAAFLRNQHQFFIALALWHVINAKFSMFRYFRTNVRSVWCQFSFQFNRHLTMPLQRPPKLISTASQYGRVTQMTSWMFRADQVNLGYALLIISYN